MHVVAENYEQTHTGDNNKDYRIYSNKRRGVNSFGAKSLGRRLLEGGGNWRAAFISRKYARRLFPASTGTRDCRMK